jgi:hypothetical protein
MSSLPMDCEETVRRAFLGTFTKHHIVAFSVKNERFTVFFVPGRFMTISERLRFENGERLGMLNA